MYKTLLFDSWGTLVDNYSIADVIEPYVYESHTAHDIATDWRFQQKWAMFYTTLSEGFVPHPGLTEAALRWALDNHGVKLPEAAIKDITSQYHKLRAYADVPDALRRMRQLGLTLKIVANPTKQMLVDHAKYAGIHDMFDEIISSGEEAKAFKPSPKVFQLGITRAGCPKDQILWVSSHFWEVYGANVQALATAWVNRARQPALKIGFEPTFTVPHMGALVDALEQRVRKAG